MMFVCLYNGIRLYKEGRLKISDTEMWNLFNIVMSATGDSLKRAYKKFLTEEEIQNRGVNQRGLLEWRMREEVTDRLKKKFAMAREKIEDEIDKFHEKYKTEEQE